MKKIELGTLIHSSGDGSYWTEYLATPQLAQQVDDWLMTNDKYYEPPCEATSFLVIEEEPNGTIYINGGKLCATLEDYVVNWRNINQWQTNDDDDDEE